MAEIEEELKSLLMKVKEESEKAGLKLNIQKTNIMTSASITSWQIDGETVESGEGNGTPLQFSCLENPMYGGAWWATVHGVAQSRTRLSKFTFNFPTGVPRINSCMSLVRTAGSLQWLQELLGSWVVPASPAASDQGRNC